MITTSTNTQSTTTPTATSAIPTTPAAAAAPGGALGKNEFLKLLVAQMQNQDPLNPMQGDQMAAQLAQFSSLEQLTQMNETLTGAHTDNTSLLSALQTSAGIGTIGHTVFATGNQLLVGANGPTTVTANVSGFGGKATLNILDSNGNVVGTSDLGEVPGGLQTFDVTGAEKNLPPGHYSYAIAVQDTNGKPVDVQTYVSGKVDGVQTTPQGIMLTAGGLSIPYASVVQILQ